MQLEAQTMSFGNLCDITWQAQSCLQSLPVNIQEMMLDATSLTARLKQMHGASFYVEVLSQHRERLQPVDQQFLTTADSYGSVREVVLHGTNLPVVFARSVFPDSSINSGNAALEKLGNRPLGEFIFSQPDFYRSPYELSFLPAQQFSCYLPAALWDKRVAIRRSLIYLKQNPVSIYEAFLETAQYL